MKFEDIPDFIYLKSIYDTTDHLSISYAFDGKPKSIEVEKEDHDENWKELMGKKVNQYRAFLVALNNEQNEWNKREAKSTVENNLHPLFQGILGSYGMK